MHLYIRVGRAGIVELHGGEIMAKSLGLGKGATFTVRLPLLDEQSSAPKPRTGRAQSIGGSWYDGDLSVALGLAFSWGTKGSSGPTAVAPDPDKEVDPEVAAKEKAIQVIMML